jgi:hypothetical protein
VAWRLKTWRLKTWRLKTRQNFIATALDGG